MTVVGIVGAELERRADAEPARKDIKKRMPIGARRPRRLGHPVDDLPLRTQIHESAAASHW